MKIATRSSKLALRQVEIFQEKLNKPEIDYQVIKQITEGDVRSASGESLFDKAYFVEDIEASLIEKKADVAIHSLKDMPSKDTNNLEIFAGIMHNNRSDILLYTDENILKNIHKVKIGTSSLRRKRQCKYFLKNENVIEVRGNIDTRIQKLHAGEVEALILAKAGIDRLGLKNNYIELDFLPAVGQGIIAVQCRSDDKEMKCLIGSIRDEQMMHQIEIERLVVSKLDADCHSALSVLSEIKDQKFKLKVEIYGEEKFISESCEAELNIYEKKIDEFVNHLVKIGGKKILHDH
tara:strand:- start:53 stop:928 length:876 start_codon:yes stop_codon:yes gene_type:complete